MIDLVTTIAFTAGSAMAQVGPGAPADHPVAKAPTHRVAEAAHDQDPVAPAGDVLWDQPTDGGTALVDQVFPDFPDFDTYLVNDVIVEEPGWNIDSIATFFTTGNGTWPTGDTPAILNIFPKTGTLPDPGDDPNGGTAVTADLQLDVFGGVLTASGLNINLAPGEYWIGLTPDISFGQFGQEFHQQMFFPQGDPTAGRNPGGAFDLGSEWFDAGVAFTELPGWDGAIRITGTEGAGCAADCNGDGMLNVLDFVCFQGEWTTQTPFGDCNADGAYDVLDFVCYQGLFTQGCP